MRIAIVDDISTDRKQLKKHIRDYFLQTNVPPDIKTFSSGEAMLASFTPGVFDLAFLDIVMDGMDGVTLAKRLREEDMDIILVFLTSSKEYALDAYSSHPFDYLVKPVEVSVLKHLLDEITLRFPPPEPELQVRMSNNYISVPFKHISAVVSQGHTIQIHLTDGRRLSSTATFKELSDAFMDDERFLLCNRGILVNMDHVASLTDDVLHMADGSIFPLRVRGRTAVISRFSQYMVSRMEKGIHR